MAVELNDDRFRETFETFSSIGSTQNGGLHRVALTDANKEARDELVAELEAAEFSVRIDEVGNIFGRRSGTDDDLPPVLLGSHLDSQPYGGKYDGQLGVLTALETLLTFEEQDIETDHPVELVCWTGEEGARFDRGPLGSGAFGGKFSPEDARNATDEDGKTVAEELRRIGYDGSTPCEPFEMAAYLELHIEQGPVLEDNGNDVGIVEGIYSAQWHEVTITGQANHAGTTPMYARRDALTAAVNAVSQIETIPGNLAQEIVITVGEFEPFPGSLNVIPGEVRFTLDMRGGTGETLDEAVKRIEDELTLACDREDVSFEMHKHNWADGIEFSPRVKRALENAADRVGASSQHIMNGAGHDARYMNALTDAGMLFVPSVGGISHNESEFTEWGACVAGATVLANAALDLATS